MAITCTSWTYDAKCKRYNICCFRGRVLKARAWAQETTSGKYSAFVQGKMALVNEYPVMVAEGTTKQEAQNLARQGLREYFNLYGIEV